jgi:hypothetical protein
VTGADGTCVITRNNLKNNVVTVSFTVTNLVLSGYGYDPALNLVTETVTLGDSGGGGEDPPPDPDPPPSGDASLTVTAYKIKGIQHVDLTWTGLAGSEVTISRNGTPIDGSPTSNDGAHTDAIGLKGGGSYDYLVCETDTSTCASGNATF